MRLNKMQWVGKAVLIIAMTLLCSHVVQAQSVASISGRADDSSGAAIAGAQITAKNLETGETRTATADESGSFRLLSLPVGRYEIRAEKEGFKTEIRSGIDLVVGQEAVINVSLEIGSLAQEVTVTTEAPLINTTTAATSGLVNENEVKDLPLNGRSYDNLITLNAGTANFTGMKTGGTPGNLFSVSGRRIDQNLFLINGIEWGGAASQQNSPNSVSGQLLGIDAVREFNVLTDNYSAEYGKRSGGQVLVVTMGGTNQLHGSVFEFLRNSAMDARNPFDQSPASLGARIPHFTRNNFGGSLGGPIRKDKTFLFGNYEELRQLLALTGVAVVPDLGARAGCLPYSSTNAAKPYPTTSDAQCAGFPGVDKFIGFAPGVAAYLALWPLPNTPSIGGGAANFLSSPRSTISQHYGTARVDQLISDKDSLNGVYTVDDGVSFTPQAIPNYEAALTLRTQVVSLAEVHTFSSNMINTATIGFSRAAPNSSTPSTITVPDSLAYVAGYPGYTAAITVGAGAGGVQSAALTGVGGALPATDARNLFTEMDSVQITHGKHLFAFGVWFHQIEDNSNQGISSGKVNFTNIQNFLQGSKQSWQGTPFSIPMSFRSHMGAWFVEDTIRLRPNLTLNAGLRHEFTNGWNEANGNDSVYFFNANDVINNKPTIGTAQFSPNYAKWLFSPRLGLAWDVFGNGKTAVHSGFGIYYNLLDAVTFWASHTPPFNAQLADTTSTFPFAQLTPTTAPPGVLNAPAEALPWLKTPSILAYNLKIEQQLGASMGISIGYSGSHGIHVLTQSDLNGTIPFICGIAAANQPYFAAASSITTIPVTPPAGTACPSTSANGDFYYAAGTPRFNPSLSSAKSINGVATSNYNGLIVEFVQRTRHGFSFRTNYTWSKAMDSASEFGFSNATSTLLNVYDPHFDWAPSAWDVQHRFSFNGSYLLPIGKGKAVWGNAGGIADRAIGNWQVNTIITVQSGFPVNPLLGFNQSNNGNVNNPDRPSLNPNDTGDIYHGVSIGCNGLAQGTPLGDAGHWFDPCAFVLQPAGTYGTAPRNYMRGPGLRQVDFSLFKDIPIVERMKLQFRVEAFNIFNFTNFGAPNASILNSNAVIANASVKATAGQITSTQTNSRQLQLGLKLVW